ncbi:MAG: hypothetical protein Q4G62_01755, partial [Pseudomonadota bacterium]|nr:hypothetical protein [Pseudomonadota bacterium]
VFYEAADTVNFVAVKLSDGGNAKIVRRSFSQNIYGLERSLIYGEVSLAGPNDVLITGSGKTGRINFQIVPQVASHHISRNRGT